MNHDDLLDFDFDEDDGFESMVLSSIRRCGTIDIHPNGWGVHDGMFAYSDGRPEDNRTPEEKQRRAEIAMYMAEERALRNKARLEEIERERRRLELENSRIRRNALRRAWTKFKDNQCPVTRSALREKLEPVVMRVTNCDRVAAACAINEFMSFGWRDVEQTRAAGGAITRGKWLVERVRSYRY